MCVTDSTHRSGILTVDFQCVAGPAHQQAKQPNPRERTRDMTILQDGSKQATTYGRSMHDPRTCSCMHDGPPHHATAEKATGAACQLNIRM